MMSSRTTMPKAAAIGNTEWFCIFSTPKIQKTYRGSIHSRPQMTRRLFHASRRGTASRHLFSSSHFVAVAGLVVSNPPNRRFRICRASLVESKLQQCPANRSAGAKSRFPRRAFHDSRNRCRSRTASSIRYAVAARVCRTNGRAGTRRTPWPISRSARSPRSSCKVHRFWHTSAIWRPARGVQTAKHCSACERSPATVRSALNRRCRRTGHVSPDVRRYRGRT